MLGYMVAAGVCEACSYLPHCNVISVVAKHCFFHDFARKSLDFRLLDEPAAKIDCLIYDLGFMGECFDAQISTLTYYFGLQNTAFDPVNAELSGVI